MKQARASHGAARLADGRVVVVGGTGEGDVLLRSVEIFDPAKGTWSPGADLPVALDGFTTTSLADGSVLVAGGALGVTFDKVTAEAHRYEAAKDRWTRAAPLRIARYWHTATRLDDGSVVVMGGQLADGRATAQAERYDPAKDAWVDAGKDPVARMNHVAALIGGRVLVIGGETSDGGDRSTTGSVAVYQPDPRSWRALEGGAARRGHAVAALGEGRVAVVGGTASYGEYWGIKPVDVLDAFAEPSGRWRPACALQSERQFGPIALALSKSELFVFGGGAEGFEVIRADMGDGCESRPVEAPEGFPVEAMTATPLADGRVLIVGGEGESGAPTDAAWILGACD